MKLAPVACLGIAPAWADGGTTADYLALQRCLHCVGSGCRTDGSPFPSMRESTTSLGSRRDVEVQFGSSVIAYPSATTQNENTGQNFFTFDVDEDVTILAASPPPRVKGVPGFWAFASGTPYFCPTSQIASAWNAPDMGSPFKILLAPMVKERGVRLRRYPRDSSLAEVWGMDNSELTKWTPTLKCKPELNPKEKVLRDNAYFALTDAIRFDVIDQALRTCKRSFLNERNVFLNNLKWGCLQPKLPFKTSLMPKLNQARELMDKTAWPKACCAQKFDDIFTRRFGKKGLPDDYTAPVCTRETATINTAAPASGAAPLPNKLPAD
ncbi:MAG: hypothetical protein HY074_07125 [Deltaproteobacteria bacterium]|nr:hypothetical protein [Deltaproteobacteria bacterium]